MDSILSKIAFWASFVAPAEIILLQWNLGDPGLEDALERKATYSVFCPGGSYMDYIVREIRKESETTF